MLKNLISKLNQKVGDILFGENKNENYELINYWLSEAERFVNINPRLAFAYVKQANNFYKNYHPDINPRMNKIIFRLGDIK